MTLADQAAFKTLAAHVEVLEKALLVVQPALTDALARIAELEAKRGPGRPPKEVKAA